MIHYSCDRCRRVIDPELENRYCVKIEVDSAVEPCDEDGDDDRDHLLEIHEILERSDNGCDEFDEDAAQRMRFDLCPECYKKFIQSPLGREPVEQFGFSKN